MGEKMNKLEAGRKRIEEEVTAKVKPFETEEQYEKGLVAVERLFGSAPGSPESKLLDGLVVAIREYESIHYPIPAPTPEAAEQYEREKRGEVVLS